MNNTNKVLTLKYTVYSLLLLLLYVMQTTPTAFTQQGVGPNLTVPAAIAIAMFEGEFVGGIFGMAAGLLCDLTGPLLFGFNGFFVGIFCTIAGLLFIYLLRCNLLGCLLFTLVALMIRGSIEFLFGYGMWGYDNVSSIYLHYTLPTVAWSLLFTPLLFWLFGRLHRAFTGMLRD